MRVIEYEFANKLDALGKLFDHLRLTTPITPLEALLAVLAAELTCGFHEVLEHASCVRQQGHW